VDALATNVLVSLVALVVGYLIGRRPLHLFQNRSEATLRSAILKQFHAPDFHLLNHVTLRTKTGTTQIDHILVSRFGVFVIEAKDYKGWIFANSADRHWTQVLFRAKFRFRNPIHQNYKHVCAVRELLGFLPAEAVISAVVFTGTAEFRTPIPGGVHYINGFLSYLASLNRGLIPIPHMQTCVGKLEMARLAVSKRTDVEHVQLLRDRYGDKD
jgi:Nuclease-related domain